MVILGDGGVGKSSLMARFVNNTFDAQSYHTIGVEFLNKDIPVDGQVVHLQIWDTAGQERFKSLVSQPGLPVPLAACLAWLLMLRRSPGAVLQRTPFYRGTDCCMLVFDLTDRLSFSNLAMWMEEFLHYADVSDPTAFPFVLIGTKVDMEHRQVSEEEARQFCAARYNMPYYETSSKTSVNVEDAFVQAARLLLAREVQVKAHYTDTVKLDSKGSGGCC